MTALSPYDLDTPRTETLATATLGRRSPAPDRWPSSLSIMSSTAGRVVAELHALDDAIHARLLFHLLRHEPVEEDARRVIVLLDGLTEELVDHAGDLLLVGERVLHRLEG